LGEAVNKMTQKWLHKQSGERELTIKLSVVLGWALALTMWSILLALPRIASTRTGNDSIIREPVFASMIVDVMSLTVPAKELSTT
jgi:hypothetical protein